MKSDTSTWNPNKFCLFHHQNDHDIEDCYALKKIEKLIVKVTSNN